MEINKKSKRIVSNTLYTIGGALVLNGVLQLLVYPRLAADLGAEQNGTMLYLMSLVSILGPSIGQALNNSRLVLRRNLDVSNGDYGAAVLIYSLIGIIGALAVGRTSLVGAVSWILLALLILVTDFRYYGDVEYRLSLNYRRYFIYYAITGVGYALGYLIYRFCGNWYVVFLIGEVAALIYLLATGQVYRKLTSRSPYFKVVMGKGALLVMSYFVTNLTLNIDRLFLKHAIGGEAVTIYYVVSLLGKTLVLFIAPINTIVISYLTKDRVKIDRKKFLTFAGIGCAAAFVFFVMCEIATPIFIRLLYPSILEAAKPLITVVTVTQILAMLSAYLFIIVLTFTGEKWQLILQCCHLVLVLILVFLMTPGGGILGFSVAVLIANSCRVLVVLVLGFMRAAPNSKQ